MTNYNNLLDHVKRDYYHTKIEEGTSDPKALSKVVDDILHRNKNVKLPNHTSAAEMSNRFADFFEDNIDKIRSSLSDVSHKTLTVQQSH